LVLYMAS